MRLNTISKPDPLELKTLSTELLAINTIEPNITSKTGKTPHSSISLELVLASSEPKARE